MGIDPSVAIRRGEGAHRTELIYRFSAVLIKILAEAHMHACARMGV